MLTCGLYYKHVTIVNDNSSAVRMWSFKLSDDPSVVIYNFHGFIIQAIGFNVNSDFDNIWWFEVQHFDYLKCSVIRFDVIKNVELNWSLAQVLKKFLNWQIGSILQTRIELKKSICAQTLKTEHSLISIDKDLRSIINICFFANFSNSSQ